jgi:plastocyanin
VRRHLLPSIALLGVLVLAGCGGSASPSAAGVTQPASQEAPPASAPEAEPSSASKACEETTEPGTVQVSIAGNAFEPDTVEAGVGEAITWTNEDGVPHSAVVSGAGCGTATLRQGDSGSLVFTAPGTYDYVCGIHSNMTATIVIAG